MGDTPTNVEMHYSTDSDNRNLIRVIFSVDDVPTGSMVLWRNDLGTIWRKTDVFEDRYELITDSEDLMCFAEWFHDRDRAAELFGDVAVYGNKPRP